MMNFEWNFTFWCFFLWCTYFLGEEMNSQNHFIKFTRIDKFKYENKEERKKGEYFLLWLASESRFLCQHLSTANPIHSCKLCSIKSFNAHFASHQCLMVYGKRGRKAKNWLYIKRNDKQNNINNQQNLNLYYLSWKISDTGP